MRCIFLTLSILIFGTANAQKEDSIITNNAVLHYYSYGKGTPIVILSGGPGLSSHQEDDLALKLSAKYQAILFDQRGTGKSHTTPFDSTTINLETYLEDLERLRKRLKLEKLNISGHSWGAILASAYTAKYPEHVNTLILIGGGELDTTLTDAVNDNIDVRFQLSDTTKWYYYSDPVNIAKDSLKASEEIRRIRWSLLSYDRDKLDAIMQQAAHGTFNDKVNKLMWKEIRKFTESKFANIALKYHGKTLIIFGWQDPIGLTTISSYKRIYPKASVIGINKAGHMPGVEQPDIFFKKILDFLQTALK